jgi:hypothetical protein
VTAGDCAGDKSPSKLLHCKREMLWCLCCSLPLTCEDQRHKTRRGPVASPVTSFCLLSVPLSIVTASRVTCVQYHMHSRHMHMTPALLMSIDLGIFSGSTCPICVCLQDTPSIILFFHQHLMPSWREKEMTVLHNRSSSSSTQPQKEVIFLHMLAAGSTVLYA